MTPRPRPGRRIADAALHLWPRLPFRCDVCGHPIDKATYPVHPTCTPTHPKAA